MFIFLCTIIECLCLETILEVCYICNLLCFLVFEMRLIRLFSVSRGGVCESALEIFSSLVSNDRILKSAARMFPSHGLRLIYELYAHQHSASYTVVCFWSTVNGIGVSF